MATGTPAFQFINRKEYGKIGLLFASMFAIAHLRRKEMQKRWLSKGQTPGLADHPIVPYVIENASCFSVAYLMLRYLPQFSQTNLKKSYLLGLAVIVLAVEPLIILQKLAAVYLYPHVKYFAGRAPEQTLWDVAKDYLTCNIPASMIANLIVAPFLGYLSKETFREQVTHPKPLELMPYLAKYAFCRVVIDVLFGIVHRFMHENPRIYNLLHKTHHEHQSPRSPTNFHFGVLDIMLEAFFPAFLAISSLTLMGHPANITETFCLVLPLTYFNTASHAGKEIPIVSWFPLLSPLIDALTGCDQRLVEYHTRHHQLYRCNYSISPWVDQLWGTYRIDLPEHYNSVEAEKKQ